MAFLKGFREQLEKKKTELTGVVHETRISDEDRLRAVKNGLTLNVDNTMHLSQKDQINLEMT